MSVCLWRSKKIATFGSVFRYTMYSKMNTALLVQKRNEGQTHTLLADPSRPALPLMKASPTNFSRSNYRFLDSFVRSFGMN